MPYGHRHAHPGQGGTRAYAARSNVNPCLGAVNPSIAIRSLDPQMIPGSLGSTPEIRYNFNIVN